MKYQVTVTSEKHTGAVVFALEAEGFEDAIETVKAQIMIKQTIVSREIKIGDLHFVARRA